MRVCCPSGSLKFLLAVMLEPLKGEACLQPPVFLSAQAARLVHWSWFHTASGCGKKPTPEKPSWRVFQAVQCQARCLLPLLPLLKCPQGPCPSAMVCLCMWVLSASKGRRQHWFQTGVTPVLGAQQVLGNKGLSRRMSAMGQERWQSSSAPACALVLLNAIYLHACMIFT